MKEWKLLVEQAKMGDEESKMRIINMLEPKINKSLLQTKPQERTDLKQELIVKTLSVIQSFDTSSVPGFWRFMYEIENDAPRPKAAGR
jgi:hypothetical protein